MLTAPDLNTDEGRETLFESIAAGLQQDGCVVTTNALPLLISSGLLHRIATLQHEDFRHAGTGRGQEHQLNRFVRRDRIRWLHHEHPAESAWLGYMAALQHYLNRRLFLGLFSYEGHFAHYSPGDFYRRHMDAFQGQANRILTTVLYLNPDWESRDGGELVIYEPGNHDTELCRVRPAFGTLVTFLSEEYPHEVLPAQRNRYSIAGWFRLNSSTGTIADPPR